MSSILKALKKVEKENATGGGQNWPSRLVTSEPIHRHARSKRLFNRALALASVVILAGLMAGYIYLFKADERGQVPGGKPLEQARSEQSGAEQAKLAQTNLAQTGSEQTQSEQAGAEQGASQRSAAEIGRSIGQPLEIEAAAPAQSASVGSSSRRSTSKDGARPVVSTAPPVPKAVESSSASRTVPAEEQAESAENGFSNRMAAKSTPMASRATSSSPSGAAVPSTTPLKTGGSTTGARSTAAAPQTIQTKQPAALKAKAPARIKVLKDSRLKLQAIAWSGIPENRMAVVNGQIVREGSSIDGFSVTTIGPDEIIVREKNQQWRIEFGLKQ